MIAKADRVYRDGVRVYDYGEPGNDWLELGTRRVNIPTKKISNNVIIGAIHLKRHQSDSLIEKTNREGFIEDDAYHCFCDAVLYVIDKIESLRNADKEKVQTLYGFTSKAEPVLSTFAQLRSSVQEKVGDLELKKELTIWMVIFINCCASTVPNAVQFHCCYIHT